MPLRGTRTAGVTLKIGYYTQEIASDPSAGVAYMIRIRKYSITFVIPQNMFAHQREACLHPLCLIDFYSRQSCSSS
ncbi:MAG: hypothetical protein ACLRZ6_07295 [Lachnospiraceae bacterium]